MEDSLQDWYESQLGQPQECWQALADQRQTSDLSTSIEPSSTLADFDAFLREGFAESDRSLGIGDPLQGLQLPPRHSSDVLEIESSETAVSAPETASAPLLSAGSAPISRPHATATWEPVETARTSSGPSSTSLKKLLQGRESQRRFREKQKVHSLHEGVALHTYIR